MTEELDDHFRDGYTLNYDVPPNKFMVDWDIKEFIKIYIGAKKNLPDWDEIAQESY